jgi:hypothetical protein
VVSAILLAGFCVSMALAARAVEFILGAFPLIPQQRSAQIEEEAVHWNYTTVLNIIFLMLAAALLIRFQRTGVLKCCA